MRAMLAPLSIKHPGIWKSQRPSPEKQPMPGVAPEDGISAIIVAADAVTNMQLLRIDEETTANIGTFLAEGPNNIVPETVRISAEIRSHNPQKLQKHCNQMIEALENACRKYHAALQYTTEVSYASYHIPQNDPLILLLRDCCDTLGLPVSIVPTGGGSDAQYL